jgi:predicted TIM-barrel fold metal-dependent hydrolase
VIVDFRARPNTDVYMATCTGPAAEGEWLRFGFPPPPVVDLALFAADVRSCGIDKAVFTGRMKVENGQLVRGFPNDYVADCVASHPDLIVGMAGADASDPDAPSEVRRAVGDLGLRGLSLDPAHTNRPPDHPQFYPLYEVAAQLDIPVVLTMGPLVGPVASDPIAVDHVASDFPGLTIVCSHGCWPRTDEFIALAYRHDHVYLEASIYEFLPGAEPFIDAARDLLQDKVLYASAFPFNPLNTIERFRRAFDFRPEVLDKILGGNAARILKL